MPVIHSGDKKKITDPKNTEFSITNPDIILSDPAPTNHIDVILSWMEWPHRKLSDWIMKKVVGQK